MLESNQAHSKTLRVYLWFGCRQIDLTESGLMKVSFQRPYPACFAALYSRTQLIAVFDKAYLLELRLRVRLIGNENR